MTVALLIAAFPAATALLLGLSRAEDLLSSAEEPPPVRYVA